jgi:tetratricopeptide (TPR) repeat protein
MTRTMDRPYPGARPFQRADCDLFFGRRLDTAVLANLWRRNSLTIASGPTGSGKTSLLQSGILPLVQADRSEVLPTGRFSYGVTFPAAALPEHNPYTVALLGSWSPGESMTRLTGLTVQEYLHRRAERHDGTILAVIDQAEELLADSGPRISYRRQLLSDLSAAARNESQLHLLLCVRESAAEEIFRALDGGARYTIAPLGYDEALEAVTGPAEAAGHSFEPGAAEEFVASILTSSISTGSGSDWSVTDRCVQPALLQVACVRLWDSLPDSLHAIAKRDVRRYGDVDAALQGYVGQVIAEVADQHDIPSARLQAWLTRTFVNDLGRRGTAYEGRTDTAGFPNTMARALEDRYLLSSEQRSGSRWYELLSDRLIEPLRHATEENPPPVASPVYLHDAGRAVTLGDFDLAERYAQDAVRVCPDQDLRVRARAQSLLGNIAHERGKPADAEIRYRQAAGLFEAARDGAAVAHQLAAVGRTLLDQERPADAVEELRSAVDRLPNDLLIQTQFAGALWQLGEPRTAEAVFTRVLEIDGGNAEALRGRGEILADLGDARAALRDLDRLVPAKQPSVHAARGLALALLGEQSDAAEEIKAALTDAPRNGPVLFYAARAEMIGGDQATAAGLAERAITATDPSLPRHQRQAAQELSSQLGAQQGGYGRR